jgi:hypothetical protein
MKKKLWEILVPTGFKKKHHKAWDREVSKIAGGLTLFKPKKGRWLSDSKLFEEKMIPVRIAATKKEIKEIAEFTSEHYKQKAIMFYLISNQVKILEYE